MSTAWTRSAVVLAPMAGGPSTVDLAAAVAEAGGFPFLAGAYLTPKRLRSDIADLRARTSEPFGVNIFAPSPDEPSMTAAAQEYAARLAPWAAAAGVELGTPRYDDDHFAAKVDVLVDARPALVSFAFGWPPAEVVARLQTAGVEVWTTLNEPAEVEWAAALGVDGVVAQGWEAGGHRGGPVDTGREQLPVRDLVREVRARTDLPLIAAGGLMTGGEAAEVLAAGADAAAFGTAFLTSPEAGTAPVHAHALTHREGTVVTRAFTGRSARALRTAWTDGYGAGAPAAYPHVHHVTAPLRAHGKATGEADLVHLWSGTGHARLRPQPAGELCRTLLGELAAAR
ncbi:nitroalkane oxidase [Pedococcus cremeus]|uniref:Propionate 3-nitronate monooxygenase n=1 Tax=Pedococcus cremeus TaxID=587636 RepID=A0A1H9UX01_9MICO|nr:nitronate monooxygenase [Pedococcus cremeus]SES13858.1 nitroalkane oxidase [Pedococcus cremeus]